VRIGAPTSSIGCAVSATAVTTTSGQTLSLRDRKRFNLAYVSGHQQITDTYLLGLAHSKGGRLATFDRSIPFKAVVGAKRETLAVIAAVEPAP
jgi:hypothetical protein